MHRGVSKNTLMLAIFQCYKWDLFYLMLCNFFSICFQLAQPFFLYFLIDYIRDGENRVEAWGINFHDFSGVKWMEWLT